MKKIINGTKYKFCVVFQEEEFFIRAVCLSTKRYSSINNLNPILLEFQIDSNLSQYNDSNWVTKESNELYKLAVNFLSDKPFRDYIENKLDEDRFYGEWENHL